MKPSTEEALALAIRDYVKEQKWRRRGSMVFKILCLMVMGYGVMHFYNRQYRVHAVQKPHVAMIDIKGVISDEMFSTADHVAASLRSAMKDPKTKAVILRINSPGGSGVQAHYLYNEIQYQKKQHPNIKIYAVCMDICASAAYYVASAADAIYADPLSFIGSIGVIMGNFDASEAIKKLGIQRRVLTAGAHKNLMDPFSPMSSEERTFLQHTINQVHQQFIQDVVSGRKGKLQTQKMNLFSGLIWSGIDAKKLGLIDDFGSAGSVARDIIKQSYIIDYTMRPHPVDQILNRLG